MCATKEKRGFPNGKGSLGVQRKNFYATKGKTFARDKGNGSRARRSEKDLTRKQSADSRNPEVEVRFLV